MNLAEETRLYQAALEEQRQDPDDEELQQVVAQQKQAMEAAWNEDVQKDADEQARPDWLDGRLCQHGLPFQQYCGRCGA